MFTTLLAEETRTQARVLILTTGACALVSLCFLGVAALDLPIISALAGPLALVVAMILPVVIALELVAEYWQSMSGQRGYLTMSLPARGRTILAAKLVHAVAVTALAIAVAAVLVLAWGAVMASGLGMSLSELLFDRLLAGPRAGVVVFMLVSALLGALFAIVEVLAVMSIGAQGRWNHLGIGSPMIGLVLLYLVNQLLGLAAVFLLPFSVNLHTGELLLRPMLPDFIHAVRTDTEPSVVGAGVVLVGLVLAVVLTWWAVRAVEKHTCLR